MTVPDVSADLEADGRKGSRSSANKVAAQAKENGLAWLEGYEKILEERARPGGADRQGHRAGLGDHTGHHPRQLRPGNLRGLLRGDDQTTQKLIAWPRGQHPPLCVGNLFVAP